MPHDRFYSDHPLTKGSVINLEGDEFHHLSRVMRAQEGDNVNCFNGKGVLATACVQTLYKQKASLQITESLFTPPSTNPLIIAQAYLRANKLELILEKGCELGMNALWLFKGDFSEKGELSNNQSLRIKHILINACKQCGQLWLPEVILKPPLKGWNPSNHTLFFGDTEPDAPPFGDIWKKNPPLNEVLFFVGPEKGFSAEETATLKTLKAQGVKLAPYILRSETAPLAALSLMSHWLIRSTM